MIAIYKNIYKTQSYTLNEVQHTNKQERCVAVQKPTNDDQYSTQHRLVFTPTLGNYSKETQTKGLIGMHN